MAEEKINININDGKAFFANELSINFNPMQFFFDFRRVSPRNDPRSSKRPSVLCEHNVIISDPYHAKEIHRVLTNMLKAYEKEFGEIQKPDALGKFEEKRKTQSKDKPKAETPSYFS
jgi:hypothetical protein